LPSGSLATGFSSFTPPRPIFFSLFPAIFDATTVATLRVVSLSPPHSRVDFFYYCSFFVSFIPHDLFLQRKEEEKNLLNNNKLLLFFKVEIDFWGGGTIKSPSTISPPLLQLSGVRCLLVF